MRYVAGSWVCGPATRRARQGRPNYTRRQDCPPAYIINGSIYAINAQSLILRPMHEMQHISKMVQPWEMMIDLDSMEDWKELEFKMQSGYYTQLFND